MRQNLVNFSLFQAVYFVCVLGAASGRPWIGLGAAAALLPINLWFFPRARWGGELGLWLVVGMLGLVVDSVLYGSGVIGFPEGATPNAGRGIWAVIVPPWIVALWVTVGSTLNGSLAWLRGRTRLAAVLGAIGGPFSFWSGARMGATELPLNAWSYLALAVEYAVIFPLLLVLAAQCGGASAPRTDAP